MLFNTPDPISAVLDIPAGRVRLIATDQTDTTVEVLPADASRSRDAKAVEQTTATCQDGVLRVRTAAGKQLLGPSGSIEVTVRMPAGSHVKATCASVELRTEGRLGDLDLQSEHGPVEIEEASSARVTTAAGDVLIGRLQGPAQINTGQGDIRVTEAVRGAVVLRTQAGDVSVGAATGVSASLDAGTTYGRIHNALKNSEGADAQLAVHASTAYGDISARSL